MEKLVFQTPEKLTLTYTRQGNGAPILFIPGGNQEILFYQHFIEYLAQFFEVYCVNYPGFMGSSRPRKKFDNDYFDQVLLEIIRAFHLERPILVGHSMGAGIIANFATLYPDMLEKMILFSPLVGNPSYSLLYLGYATLRNYLIHRRKHSSAYPFSLKRLLSVLSRIDQSFPQGIFVSRFERRDWNSIVVPTLAVIGAQDRIFDPSVQEQELRAIPNVRVEILDSGHDVVITEREQVVKLIQEFVKE